MPEQLEQLKTEKQQLEDGIGGFGVLRAEGVAGLVATGNENAIKTVLIRVVSDILGSADQTTVEKAQAFENAMTAILGIEAYDFIQNIQQAGGEDLKNQASNILPKLETLIGKDAFKQILNNGLNVMIANAVANKAAAVQEGAQNYGINLGKAKDLSGLDLSGLDLSHTDFSTVNLSNTNFTGANLTGANLTGSDITNANVSMKQLKQVSSVKGLQGKPVQGFFSKLKEFITGHPSHVITQDGQLTSWGDLTKDQRAAYKDERANLPPILKENMHTLVHDKSTPKVEKPVAVKSKPVQEQKPAKVAEPEADKEGFVEVDLGPKVDRREEDSLNKAYRNKVSKEHPKGVSEEQRVEIREQKLNLKQKLAKAFGLVSKSAEVTKIQAPEAARSAPKPDEKAHTR